MALPTQQQLEERQQKAEERLQHLQTSYKSFLQAWGGLEAEEKSLLAKLHSLVDTTKIHKVLHLINKIKD